MSHDLDLDDDPRDPDTQAADFFTRPGDFHQIDLAIPVEDDGLTLGAQFVIKFTPDQKPLIIEVLRQLRGALAARITITRMNQTSESDIAGRNSTPNVAIDNGPPIHITDCALGQPDNSAIQEATDWYRQRNQVAADLGARPHQLTPIPMSNGQTAWAVTPPPTKPAGRHHKTDLDTDTDVDELKAVTAEVAEIKHSLQQMTDYGDDYQDLFQRLVTAEKRRRELIRE